ncbi:MAG: YfjI family protein [Rhodoferax sp.]|nr:YfjI family protein [Rhodoferax sp.]
MNTFTAKPFPISSAPELLKNAVIETQNHTQAPMSMVFSSALAAMSLACQDQFRVKLQAGHETPASLYLISIAESGERKTYIDRLMFQEIRNFENLSKDRNEKIRIEYETEMEFWELEHATHVSSFQKALRKGLPTNTQKLALELHKKSKPALSKVPKLIYNDATPEAIAWGLHSHWPSGGLVSDEAGMVLGGHAGRNLALLNKLRDGDSVTVDRKSAESFTVSNPNFTLALMIQPKLFQNFLENQGKNARDIGFFSRCLINYPESTQGTRHISSIQDVVWKDLTIFQNRIGIILEGGIQNNLQANKTTLELSTEARTEWLKFYNCLESSMGAGCYFCEVRDAASKMAETTIRMAALFHHFDGRAGNIQIDIYKQAEDICAWYLEEFKNIFAKKPEIPIEKLDSQQLEKWLWEVFMKAGRCNPLKKNWVRQYCSNSLRSKNRLNGALMILADENKLTFDISGRTEYINLNPYHFCIRPASHQRYDRYNQSVSWSATPTNNERYFV